MASAKDAAGSAMENLVVAQIIQEKLDGGGLPIIVGGTNFYTQAARHSSPSPFNRPRVKA